jgi:putative ABC transport system permease protein
MYTRLLLESLRRGTRRKLLAVSAVALGTFGATALAEVMLSSGDRIAAEMSSYGANMELVPAAGRQTLAVADLPAVRKIFWRNNIVALAPFQDVRVRLQPDQPGETVAPLVGTWFDHDLEGGWRTGLPRVRPTLRVAGRWPAEGTETTEIVLGRRLATRLGLSQSSTQGGEVRARLGAAEASFRVVGLLTSGGEEEEQAFAPLAAVQRLTGQSGRFTSAEVFALTNPETKNPLNPDRDPKRMTPEEYEAWYCTAYPSAVAFQLGQAVPGSTARVVYGITAATADVMGRLRGVLIALAIVALAGSAVGVTAAMTATVLERRLEAGLMVAIGAPRAHVVLFFLSEAALLGLLGGLAGGGLGLIGGRLLGSGALGIAVPWMPQLLPFAALLGLGVAVCASFAPVVRAMELYPAAILKRATA